MVLATRISILRDCETFSTRTTRWPSAVSESATLTGETVPSAARTRPSPGVMSAVPDFGCSIVAGTVVVAVVVEDEPGVLEPGVVEEAGTLELVVVDEDEAGTLELVEDPGSVDVVVT